MVYMLFGHVVSSSMSSEHSSASASWRAGFRVGGSLGAGTFALAVSFGAFAALHGWPAGLVIVMSVLVFSGSAQFALVTSMAGGGGLITGLGAATLINTRFIPMAAATARSLRGGRIRRALEGQAVVDGSFVSAQRPEGAVDREKLIAATLVQWAAWVLGTAIGAIFVPSTSFIHAAGLDLIFPCFFLMLLLDALKGHRKYLPVAGMAALIGLLACLALPAGAALLLSGSASGLSALHKPRSAA
jgi:4-azaleucine resistance transporter AzlC